MTHTTPRPGNRPGRGPVQTVTPPPGGPTERFEMSDPKFSFVIEATFVTVADATTYESKCSGPNNWVRPGTFTRKGRKCSWIKDVPTDASTSEYESMWDTLEQVGYYGSTTRRKATVTIGMDGAGFICVNRPAPVSF